MLRFDWDSANTSHVAQHGITTAEAEQVILNEPIDLKFELRGGEECIAQVGETNAGRILVVITTMREESIRVITAFPAKQRLRRFYQTQKRQKLKRHE